MAYQAMVLLCCPAELELFHLRISVFWCFWSRCWPFKDLYFDNTLLDAFFSLLSNLSQVLTVHPSWMLQFTILQYKGKGCDRIVFSSFIPSHLKNTKYPISRVQTRFLSHWTATLNMWLISCEAKSTEICPFRAFSIESSSFFCSFIEMHKTNE